MTRLEEIRERLKRATLGPWELDTDGEVLFVVAKDAPPIARILSDRVENDAEFIAHSREDIERLVRAVELMRERLLDKRQGCYDNLQVVAEVDEILNSST